VFEEATALEYFVLSQGTGKNFRNFKKIPKVSHLVVASVGMWKTVFSIRKFGESAFCFSQ
jgi:hypothetical protein